MRVVCAAVLTDGCADAKEDETCTINRSASKEYGAAAEVGTERDGEDSSEELEDGVDKAELEGKVGLQ